MDFIELGLVCGTTLLSIHIVCAALDKWIDTWREVSKPVTYDTSTLGPNKTQLELGDRETFKPTGEYAIVYANDILHYTVEKEENLLVKVAVDTNKSGYHESSIVKTYILVNSGAQDFLDWIGNERYSSNS